MKSLKLRSLGFALAMIITLSITIGTPQLLAQTNKAPAAEKKGAAKKQSSDHKGQSIPFNGNIKNLDKGAGTITVGKRTFHITPDTKIFHGEQPATLDSGAAGDYVTGSYYKMDGGKLFANSIYFGGKPKKPAEAKK